MAGPPGALPSLARMEARVGERLAEGAELLTRVGLHLAVHHRPPVRLLQRLADDPGEIRDVGHTEREAHVAGHAHPVARENAATEGQGLIAAGELGRAVLGPPALGPGGL